MAEIDVGMFAHEWKDARRSDTLFTAGVDACIAIAVLDDSAGRAWLIHAPTFGQNTFDLADLLDEATEERPGGAGLRIRVHGALHYKDSAPETEAAMVAVKALLDQAAPRAHFDVRWRLGGDVRVRWRGQAWSVELTNRKKRAPRRKPAA